MTNERLLELLLRAGAKEQGVGQGGAYRELVLTAWLEQNRPDIHLLAFKRFAALIETDERERLAKLAESQEDSAGFHSLSAAEIRAGRMTPNVM